jgi:osmotically-inducible protein OsmY
MPPADPDDRTDNLSAAPQDRDSRATAAQNPDYSQAPDQNRDARDRDRDRDQNRPDRDSAASDNQDRDRDKVYDRDQTYQDQDRRDQQDRDRDANHGDMNRDRDSNRDMDRDRDRSRVGVGNDVQSRIYSALQNNRNLAGVNVDVRGDRVNLTGTVPTGRDRKEALRIAQSYANGMRVDDHLSVGGRGHDNDRDDHR